MTFDDVVSHAEQEFELQMDPTGLLEYSTKYGPVFNSFKYFRTIRSNFLGLLHLTMCIT